MTVLETYNREFMTKRFSWAFLAGGILTLLVLLGLQAFAKAIGGMSAGVGASSDSSDKITTLLICSYFFVSAFGLFISKTKRALWVWAIAAHTTVLIAYAIVFFSTKNNDTDGYTWRGVATKLAVIMVVYFSPWLLLWLRVLKLNLVGPPNVRR